jgi:type III secretion protein Q
MVSIAPAPLPTLDPARQALAERLALTIEAAGDAATALRVRIEHHPEAGVWFGGVDGVALRIDEIDGAAAALHPERVDAAVAALDRVEPLLDLIEAATGWVIEPETTLDHPDAEAVTLVVDASQGEVRAARFALAVPWALAEAVAMLSTPSAPAVDGIPVPCRLDAVAAALAVDDAGAIGPGDLIVLAPAPWRATLHAGPLGDTNIRFDPVAGLATFEEIRVTTADPVPGETDAADGGEGVGAFRVPIEISLEGGAATLSELAALREGGSLPLGAVTEGLRVTLAVGGRSLGTGEVVRLGERFAVIVDRLAEAPPASEAPVVAAEAHD